MCLNFLYLLIIVSLYSMLNFANNFEIITTMQLYEFLAITANKDNLLTKNLLIIYSGMYSFRHLLKIKSENSFTSIHAFLHR